MQVGVPVTYFRRRLSGRGLKSTDAAGRQAGLCASVLALLERQARVSDGPWAGVSTVAAFSWRCSSSVLAAWPTW